jgi:hypothetical protein
MPMKKFGALKVTAAILCDDVRKEADTNKHILIGTYSGDIQLNAPFPATMPLAIYFELVVPPGHHDVDVRLSGPGKGSGIIKAIIDQIGEQPMATLVVPRLEVFMEKAGIFAVDIRGNGGRWVNVMKKKVSSTVLEQPSEQSPPGAQGSSSQP